MKEMASEGNADMNANARIVRLAGADDVETLLDDLAERIALHRTGETALVGILRRGAPLAHMLAARLDGAAERSSGRPEVGELRLKRYSDDLQVLHQRPELDDESLKIDVENRHLILVDDVMYTGESLFRAACYLRAAGARRIQIAVLCARGRPDMPVRADFVGRHLDVGAGWIIDCSVPPYETGLGIVLKHRDADSERR